MYFLEYCLKNVLFRYLVKSNAKSDVIDQVTLGDQSVDFSV